jgi:type IV pilus assembly protein PilZ
VGYAINGGADELYGHARDISLGGMFIEVSAAPEFGTEVTVVVHIPGEKSAFVLPAVVRWARDGGMGIQFGLLGARETYAITEYVSKSDIAK